VSNPFIHIASDYHRWTFWFNSYTVKLTCETLSGDKIFSFSLSLHEFWQFNHIFATFVEDLNDHLLASKRKH
jgi:hypothetical protein